MTCNKCGEKPKKTCGTFPKAVIEIDNPEKIVLLRKVLIPASMGDETMVPPAIGKYHNVLLEYEASGGIYLYSSDGIPTKLSSDVTELQAQLNALRVRVGEEEVARADADTTLSNRVTSLDNSLATVAKTGSYNDLSNKPTIGNGTLTIKKNGSNVGTFTANTTTNTDVNIVVPTKTSDLANDGSDGASQYVESGDLATVATSGSYNDLTNKPTIGNATLTIKRNNANAGTFTANATTNKSINIAVPTKTSDLTNDGADGTSTYVETRNLPTVGNATLTITENNASVGTFTANATSNKTINITSPTKTSDLTNDGADGTSTYVEADDLPTVDTTYSSSSNNAIANSTVTNSLDRNVMTNLAVDSTPSTTTVNLNNTKTNLAYPSSSTTSSISLPVASSTQAGVMNSATFDAVTSNTNNINAILNGAVAISNLPASPTQAQLTTAWENETGLTSLINRASVYDVANNKVWTYYTNDQTWHAASNTSQVTVNTFTNSSEGTIKGSTNDGQVFAESDGTGSVNGWDTLTGNVANNTSKLATIAQGAEVNVQANWTQTNTSADDYIKNKPANLVQDANYVHTDNNFTTALKDKLNGISAGAEVNVQANWTQTNTSADDYIKNKPANLVQDANYVHTDNNFTTTLKNKLDGIESGAEVNVQADWSQTDTSADDYIKNKPAIPTVNNATLTIQKNGTNVQTFTANSSTNKTANITVPTAVSELTNDAGYATTTQLNNGLATKQDTLTAGDNIQINGNTISATDTTYTAGNAIDITNGEISADIHPADFFTADDVVSDCGRGLSLDGTMASTLKSVELKGDTYQQTYSGKNLLPMVDGAVTNFGITLTIDKGILTVNGTSSATVYFKLTNGIISNSGTTVPTSWLNESVTNWNGKTLSIKLLSGTAPSSGSAFRFYADTTTYRWQSYPNISRENTFNTSEDISCFTLFINPNITFNNAKYEIQLEEGPTATAYEPYTGGVPAPNPDYPQDIQVVTGEQTVEVTGKNLFDTTQAVTLFQNRNGATVPNWGNYTDGVVTITRSNGQYGATLFAGFIPTLIEGQTYTLSATVRLSGTNAGTGLRIGTTYTTPAYITLASKDAWVDASFTFTASADDVADSRIVINANNSGNIVEIKNIQLEKGSPTAYEPYQSQSYTINLGSIELCKIGDYQDYIYKSGDDWYIHKEVGKTILDNATSMTLNNGQSNIDTLLFQSIKLDGAGSMERLNRNTLISDHFNTYNNYGTNQTAQGICTHYSTAMIRMPRSYLATEDIAGMQAWLSSNPTIVYYALATPVDILIENPVLVAQLDALAEAKSYNDQTNIIVTAAGENLPATLCVEAYRKSLNGVIEAIDNACTCRKNLVVYLPNGMTTYENNDAPIPIPEVIEALKRGQSVFLVYGGLYESVYVVTAASAEDGVYSMRADQTGINPRGSDGHWHISGGGDVWDSVTFINDATPSTYSPNIYDKTWFTFTSSTPLLDQNRRTYYPASRDVTFNNGYGRLSVAELWEKLASSAWDGNPVVLEVPLQEISTRTTNLVDVGFTAENPLLTISVSLGPDNYFERETSEYTITGWAAECTPITFDGKEAYAVGIVRVVGDGNTDYRFVVSLTEVNSIN